MKTLTQSIVTLLFSIVCSSNLFSQITTLEKPVSFGLSNSKLKYDSKLIKTMPQLILKN